MLQFIQDATDMWNDLPGDNSAEELLDHIHSTQLRKLKRLFQVGENINLILRLQSGDPDGGPFDFDEVQVRNFFLNMGHSESQCTSLVEEFKKGGVGSITKEMQNARQWKSRDLEKLAEGCKELVSDEDGRLNRTAIGQAPIWYVNGTSIPAPDGRDVVVINSGLEFLEFWVYRLMMFEQGMLKGGLDEALENMKRFGLKLPALSKSILNIPGRYLSEDDKDLFSIVFPKGEIFRQEGRGRALVLRMFIVLHEYGHVLLGHTDWYRKWRREGVEVNSILTSTLHDFEYVADGFAIDALAKMKLPNSDLRRITFCFFSLLHLAEYNLPEVEILNLRVTHPTAVKRLKNALKHCGGNYTDNDALQYLENIIGCVQLSKEYHALE